MVFGGGSSNDVEIKVTVDADGAVRAFDKLGGEIDKIQVESSKASSGFSTMQASIVTLQAGISLAAGAIAIAATNIGRVFDVVSEGSAIDDVTSAFDELAVAAGVSGDALLNKLNAAVAETIPNVQLMQQANELLIAGLKPDEIELVASAARTLGERTGIDAADGMNKLGDSLLRGNDRALKSLGIIVNVTEAQDKFAESLGKTRDTLTEEEKATANRIASLKALEEQQDRFTKASVDGGDRVAQINKFITDSFNDIKKAIASDEGVNKALDDLITNLKSIDPAAVANTFITIANSIIKITNALATATGAVSAFINKTSAFDRTIGKIGDGYKVFSDNQEKIVDLLSKDTPEATQKAVDEFNKLGKIYSIMVNQGDLLDSTVNVLNSEFSQLGDQVNASAKEFGIIKDKLIETIPPIETVKKGIGETGGAAAITAAKVKTLSDEIGNISKVAGAAIIDIPISIGGKGANKAGGASAELEDQISQLGFDIGQQVADSLAQGIELALSGGKGEDYRALIASTITDGLAAAADSYVPGSGAFVQAFEPVIGDAIESIFGGENAGTTARKAADKFFADAFDADRLGIIINGQLKEIEDLVFQGDTLFGGNSQFTDGSFSGFFDSLPDEARQAFAGVGLAFEELLGVSGDISGQIAAVLANNIGGSLNNLQLLVGSTGKSFEELRGFVVEAFLDGKISALEAQSALNGLAQVAQKGIPDGIGFTIQAFENLKAAGTKGGRALIDALQDIGYEAKELGIRDFGGLIANITQSGKFSQQEIEQVFQALRDNGINSIEELTSASTEQLLPVLSQLQAQEFPFADAATGAAELIETIQDLPNEKTLTFNIKTNFDGNTQRAQNEGYIPKYATPEAGGNVSIP